MEPQIVPMDMTRTQGCALQVHSLLLVCLSHILPLLPARRPPVEETSSFLKSLLASHGPNYLEKLFGPKARNNLQPLGGVDQVAISLSGEIYFLVLRAIFSSRTKLLKHLLNMSLFLIHSWLSWAWGLHTRFIIIQIHNILVWRFF